MCVGKAMHQAGSQNLSLGAEAFRTPPTCCGVERDSCLGWTGELHLEMVSLLFVNHEINNPYVSSVSITVSGQ